MPVFVAKKAIKKLKRKFGKINNKKVLIMGFTFKENCYDIRNTKVIDIYNFLKKEKLNS